MKKIVVIFYPEEKPQKAEDIEKIMKRNFKNFFKHFPKNIDIYYVTDKKSYKKNDSFSGGFKKIGSYREYQKSIIQADFVIGSVHKYHFNNYFKNPIRELCREKNITYNLFSKFSPKTYLCNTPHDIKQHFQKIQTHKKVVKPTIGQQWIGVQIVSNFADLQNLTFPCIVQEFIDTSHGIYNFSGVFDYRVVILNGKIIGKILRRAPKWKFIANVSSGGSVINMWNYKIPISIKKMVREVDNYMAEKFPQRYYSIDFWIDANGKAYIFEMNSAPAVSTNSIRKHLNTYIIDTYLQ